jgi:uncharacterized membrane protein HdeD (DUF308 family)
LVYAAVLEPAELGERLAILASGVAIFTLAIWAYQTDYLKWPATTAGVLGVGLALYAGFQLSEPSGFVTFWVALFVGIAVAIVSLWSSLYRQPSAPEYAARGAQLQTSTGSEAVAAEAQE